MANNKLTNISVNGTVYEIGGTDGNSNPNVDLSDYYTKSEVDEQNLWEKGTGEGASTALMAKDRKSVASGNYAFCNGYMSSATTTLAYATGQANLSQNKLEVSFGQFNNSISHDKTTFGEAGNTLFTIGNGYNYTKKYPHNAFEVRQNGDIYFPDVSEGLNYYEYAMRRLQDIPKVWKGTWDEYSKLEKMDSNTIYYIYESSLKDLYPENDLTDFGGQTPVDSPNTEFELLKDE